ncbi:MAG TPA: hypothetical protein VHL31_02840 [Geminicoccus sp.]|nr:hypothetical protein [Geminicoccus sp.]HEX2525223.1 hypothetical protein [Geminicoccus sp.]
MQRPAATPATSWGKPVSSGAVADGPWPSASTAAVATSSRAMIR